MDRIDWEAYEIAKEEISVKFPDPKDYEREILKLSERMGI
jgi:hypothetical protein